MNEFVPLPASDRIQIAWPTLNHALFTASDRFFARTRANPDYGKPGWTRDCGKRLHRGCDIAPVQVTPTGQTTAVIFTDCMTGTDYESVEPTFLPHDDVYCAFDGVVEFVETEPMASDFGIHVILTHRWPSSGERFFTLYGHLAETCVTAGQSLVTGARVGHMGQTSRSADARNWMAIAPHLHFEVRTADGRHHDPVEFLRAFVARTP